MRRFRDFMRVYKFYAYFARIKKPERIGAPVFYYFPPNILNNPPAMLPSSRDPPPIVCGAAAKTRLASLENGKDCTHTFQALFSVRRK